MSNNIKFNQKNFYIVLAFVLVLALGAGVFATEYLSLAKEKNSLSDKLSDTQSERDALSSENAANKTRADELSSKMNDLNSKVNDLNKEISNIKLTKATVSKSVASAVSKTPGSNAVVVKLDNLAAPNTGYRVCYLTFDDGPSDNTIKILDILKQAHVTASFFVVGNSPRFAYIKQIHAQGHTVALHTDSHAFASVYASDANYFKDLSAVQAKVKAQIGVEPNIIRFPGGSSNKVSKQYNKGIMTRLTKQVQAKGYKYVDWNVDSGDASGNNIPAQTLLKNVMTGIRGKGDICILMHDTGAKGTTVQALPQIICYLRAQGYRFEALKTDSPVFHHGLNN